MDSCCDDDVDFPQPVRTDVAAIIIPPATAEPRIRRVIRYENRRGAGRGASSLFVLEQSSIKARMSSAIPVLRFGKQ